MQDPSLSLRLDAPPELVDALGRAATVRELRIALIRVALAAIVAELAEDVLEELDMLTGLLCGIDRELAWGMLAGGARALESAADLATRSAEQLRAALLATEPTVDTLGASTDRLCELQKALGEEEGRWRQVGERLGSAVLAVVATRLGALRAVVGRFAARLDLQEKALRRALGERQGMGLAGAP
jgi:hypothetical protein